MPVSLVSPPASVSFTKNAVPVVIQSDDYLAGAAAYAVNQLAFPGPVAADTLILLSWKSNAVQFTTKANADDSGIQLPAGDGSAAYVASLVPFFQQNYLLDKFFTVAYDASGNRLVFTARRTGAEYNFTAAGNSSNVTPGVLNAPKANFRHHLQLWVYDAAGLVPALAFEAEMPLDEPQTGSSSLDLADMLDAMLAPDELDSLSPVVSLTQSIRRYYFRYAQFFGDVPEIRALKSSADYIAAFGGIGLQQQAKGQTLVSYLHPDPAKPEFNRMLRQGSAVKLVRTDQPEWLTYLNSASQAITAGLELKLFYADGTSDVLQALGEFQLQAYGKVQLQAGYTQLQLDTRGNGKAISYYQLRLNSGGQYISAPYTYVPDHRYREWPRYFVYWNSLGAWQTLATTGKGQTEFDRSMEDGRRSVSLETAAIDGDVLQTNIRIRDKGTVSVGYARSGSRNVALMRDFFLSPKIYLWQDGRLLPVALLTKGSKDAPDGQDIYAGSFEYQLQYEDRAWAEEPGLDDEELADLLNRAGVAVPQTLIPKSTMSTLKITNLSPGYSYAGGKILVNDPRIAGAADAIIESSQLGGVLMRNNEFVLHSGTPNVLSITHPPLDDTEFLSIILL